MRSLFFIFEKKNEKNVIDFWDNNCNSVGLYNADVVIRSHGAGVALIEVDESGEYDISYCLALCIRLRKETPQCKLLLMFPEQDKSGVDKVVKAKQK